MTYPYFYQTMPTFNMYTPFILPSATSTSALTSTAASNPEWAKPAKEFRLTKGQAKALQEGALEGMRVDHGTMAGTVGTASLWAAPSLAKNMKFKTDAITTEFLTKHSNLFETNPNLATETMQAAKKLQKKFAKDIKRFGKAGLDTSTLSTELAGLNNKLSVALESGNVAEIAKVRAEIDAANSVKNGFFGVLKRKFKGGQPLMSRSDAAAKALEKTGGSIAIPKEGKIFSNVGALGGVLFFAGTMYGEKDKIKQAYQYDKQTGNKQLFQSTSKSLISVASFTVGESAARNLVTKYAVPKMAKFAAKKLVSAGAGKVIGGAIGSCIPVVGTIVGTIVGFAVDFAFKKWISPLIFGKDEPLAKAQAVNMTEEDLLNTAIQSYSMGKELDKNSLNAIKNYYSANDNMAEFYELKKLNKKVSQMSKKEFKQYQKEVIAQQMQAQQEMQAQNTAA